MCLRRGSARLDGDDLLYIVHVHACVALHMRLGRGSARLDGDDLLYIVHVHACVALHMRLGRGSARLDGDDLLGHDREHLHVDPVELVEAAGRA
jgi:hypothetical protein